MNGPGTSPVWRGGHLEKWLGHHRRKPRRVAPTTASVWQSCPTLRIIPTARKPGKRVL
jgi:hypothetical protein